MSPIDAAGACLAGATAITCFSGAGLSAESGIGTFRGHDEDAHWQRFDPMTLASQAGFAADPELVIRWYSDRRRTLHDALPNLAHRALAALPHIRHVTQNVDDLLERAGVPAGRIHHLHGTLLADRCNRDNCGYREAVDIGDPPPLRNCPQCGAPMRPAVIWFGEALDSATWEAAEQAVDTADALLVVGSSLVVYPAAGLVDRALHAGAAIVCVDPAPDASLLSAARDNDRLHVLAGTAGDVLPRLLAATSAARDDR